MVVINNYAAASNARCITQIKFAVTNGGVFSMEKRSTDIGTLSWSQWASVGGGSAWINDIEYKINHPKGDYSSITLGAGVNVGIATNIGAFTNISGNIDIMKDETGFLLDHKFGTSVVEKDTIKLPYGLTIEPSEDGTKLFISCRGKTAELPLT